MSTSLTEGATSDKALHLPVIDVEGHLAGDPRSTRRAADQIADALTRYGFLSITGHGIPWRQVRDLYDWAARYHALPEKVKRTHPMGPATMGYMPLGGAQTLEHPALNAAFFMGRPGSGRNQFPAPDALPGFAEAATAHYQAMDRLGRRLLPLYALATGMPTDYFDQFFDPALATLRITHYPAIPAAAGQWGIDPHADAGFITMLPTNPVSGLEIRTPDGIWRRVAQEQETFVVNAGDTLKRWTNDFFLSTQHRARNETNGDRYAIPFFFDPRVDTLVEALPSCVDDNNPARYEPILYRDHLRAFMQRGYAATRPEERN